MCVNVCACTCACVCVFVHVCVCECVCVCMTCVFVCVCLWMCECVYVWKCECVCECVRVRVLVCVRAWTSNNDVVRHSYNKAFYTTNAKLLLNWKVTIILIELKSKRTKFRFAIIIILIISDWHGCESFGSRSETLGFGRQWHIIAHLYNIHIIIYTLRGIYFKIS